MTKSTIAQGFAVLALFLASASLNAARAEMITLSAEDDPNDANSIDVTGFAFTFDNLTGDYTLQLLAAAARPFTGDFLVGLGLFNVDIGTTAPDPAYFVTSFAATASTPSTSFTTTGTDSRLLSWNVGDRVAYSSAPFGSPSGLGAFSSFLVSLMPNADGDQIGSGTTSDFGVLQRAGGTVAMPEPGRAELVLSMLAVGAILCYKRRPLS